MFNSDPLFRLHIQAEGDVYDVILFNFLHLNTAYIYNNYKHLAQRLCKDKVKQQPQNITKPKRGYPPKTTNTNQMFTPKTPKVIKHHTHTWKL